MADKKQEESQPSANLNVDPVRTPVLYADNVFMKSNENGMVFDFAQQIGASNQYTVVARIGLSKEHAKSLVEHIEGLLRAEGSSSTKKNN